MCALIEALVGQKLELGRVFHPNSAGDFPLEKCSVLAKRFENGLFVFSEQRLYEHGCVAKVGGHAHFGDADEVRLQDVVMYVAALEQLAQYVPYLLADAKQADRTAFAGFLATHQDFASVKKVRRLLAGSWIVISHEPQSIN